jgi:hypothetical protein
VQNKYNTRKTSQKWNYRKNIGYLQKNKKYMDVIGGYFDNGNIIIYDCHDGNNQLFTPTMNYCHILILNGK